MEACIAGNVEMCCLLLDKGAKPNLQNHASLISEKYNLMFIVVVLHLFSKAGQL